MKRNAPRPRAAPAPAGADDPLFGWPRRHPRLAAVVGGLALFALVGACQSGRARPAPVIAPVAPVVAAEAAPAPAPPAAPTAVPVAPAPTAVPSIPRPEFPTVAPRPTGPVGGKCADYASQAEAQAALRRDPVNAGRLDDDRDGVACESNRAPVDHAPVARPARR
jgi:hypothetical protein